MSQSLRHRWTEAEFFDWLRRQHDGRYELVDGEPRAMVGATTRHDRITVNLLIALGTRLRGGLCRPGSGDTAIRIPNRNIRYPDASVDCGRPDDEAMAADEPVLVAEVLSPSTADLDQTEKLEEYRSVPTLRHVLILDTDQPRVRLHTRDAAGVWLSAPHRGLEAEVPLPALRIALPLAEIYEGVAFRPLPRLVPAPEPPAGD